MTDEIEVARLRAQLAEVTENYHVLGKAFMRFEHAFGAGFAVRCLARFLHDLEVVIDPAEFDLNAIVAKYAQIEQEEAEKWTL